MSGRCRHEIVSRAAQAAFAPGVEQTNDSNCRNPLVDAKICVTCGAWLSIGPANDEPSEVQVEIRAAEIAAGSIRAVHSSDEHGCSFCGWVAHELDESLSDRAGLGMQAGYLARCIATHPEQANDE